MLAFVEKANTVEFLLHEKERYENSAEPDNAEQHEQLGENPTMLLRSLFFRRSSHMLSFLRWLMEHGP